MKYLKKKVAELREETGMNFALARTPAESCSYRLANIDIKRYKNKAIYQGDPSNNSAYYTNSFHVRPNLDIPLFKRMSIEGAFHPLTDGGAMSHVWLGEANPNPEAVMELTKNLATKTAIQYMAFTKDLTICDACGFVTGGVNTECPKCKSSKIQVWSRITGYYQNIKGWNKGKLQELKDRRRYSA
jgi:ribonucleoside-triphosphate reductase